MIFPSAGKEFTIQQRLETQKWIIIPVLGAIILACFVYLFITFWNFRGPENVIQKAMQLSLPQPTSITDVTGFDPTNAWKANPVLSMTGTVVEKKENSFVLAPFPNPLTQTTWRIQPTIVLDAKTEIEKITGSRLDANGKRQPITTTGFFSDIVLGARVSVETTSDVRMSEKLIATHISIRSLPGVKAP